MNELTRLTLRVIELENKLSALPVPKPVDLSDVFKKLSAIEKDIIFFKNNNQENIAELSLIKDYIKNDVPKKFSFLDLFK